MQPRPGAFVVNLGDMLSAWDQNLQLSTASLGNCWTMLDRGVWTKGRYVATRHRVRQTAGDYRTGCRVPKLRQGWDMFEKHGDGLRSRSSDSTILGIGKSIYTLELGVALDRTSIAFFYEPNFDAVTCMHSDPVWGGRVPMQQSHSSAKQSMAFQTPRNARRSDNSSSF